MGEWGLAKDCSADVRRQRVQWNGGGLGVGSIGFVGVVASKWRGKKMLSDSCLRQIEVFLVHIFFLKTGSSGTNPPTLNGNSINFISIPSLIHPPYNIPKCLTAYLSIQHTDCKIRGCTRSTPSCHGSVCPDM